MLQYSEVEDEIINNLYASMTAGEQEFWNTEQERIRG
jgi:hypothetical protein